MKSSIPFTKMSGVGNDFIIIDNRSGILNEFDLGEFARRVCARRISLGGDELMVIEAPNTGSDFSMRTINPDGGEVNMCGNAARCIARYAHLHGLAGEEMNIDTRGGTVFARLSGSEARVRLQITAPAELDRVLWDSERQYLVHTIEISGTPHAVSFLPGAAQASRETIRQMGAVIRRHPAFPQGINANFIEVLDQHTLWQRTFERGVEGETLACGTGAVASSVISAMLGRVESPVRLQVLGGELSVSFQRQGDGFDELWLGGGVRFIAEGVLLPEAWGS